MVSDVSLQFSHVLEGKNRVPVSSRPARSHRAEEAPQRSKSEQEIEKKKCGRALQERRSRIGGEVNGEDKEVVGGVQKKREIE